MTCLCEGMVPWLLKYYKVKMFKFTVPTEDLILFPCVYTFQEDLSLNDHKHYLRGKQAASYCTSLDLLEMGWE